MAHPRATIIPILSVPFEENTYLAQLEGRRDCLVVDPGLEPEKIFEALDDCDWTPAAILCTHGHADHIAGNAALKQRWPDCPLVIGAGDVDKLTDPVGNLSAGFGLNLYSPPADRKVLEGEVLTYAGFRLEVRNTPGHSSGHVVFVALDLKPVQVFGGDVLFAGSVGRADFPDGSFAELRRSIHEKLFVLADDTIVLPGHGPATTIGEEKRGNPFVGLDANFEE
jgi:hydroxyacylglutathione hydrolase